MPYKQASPITLRGPDVLGEIEKRVVAFGPGRKRSHIAARDLRRLYRLEELARREPYPFTMSEALALAWVAHDFSAHSQDFTDFPDAVAAAAHQRGTACWSLAMARAIDMDETVGKLRALGPNRLLALLDVLERAPHREDSVKFIAGALGIPNEAADPGRPGPTSRDPALGAVGGAEP